MVDKLHYNKGNGKTACGRDISNVTNKTHVRLIATCLKCAKIAEEEVAEELNSATNRIVEGR